MTNRELFGVLVRWTGLVCMACGLANGAGMFGSVAVFAAGAGMFLFADAVVEFGYRPNPLAIFAHLRGGPHPASEAGQHETQPWKP